jgi:hypothetical protein
MGEDGDPGGKLTGSDHVPEVSRLASPPDAGISQMCVDGDGPWTSESFAPTSNASRNSASPSRLGSSSMPPQRQSQKPSGFQANCVTAAAACVSWTESPPFMGSTKTCALLSLSCAMYAMRSPGRPARIAAHPRSCVRTRCSCVAISTSTSSESYLSVFRFGWPDHDHNRFAVGRDLRVAHAHHAHHIVGGIALGEGRRHRNQGRKSNKNRYSGCEHVNSPGKAVTG